jgi:hypothetical protein
MKYHKFDMMIKNQNPCDTLQPDNSYMQSRLYLIFFLLLLFAFKAFPLHQAVYLDRKSVGHTAVIYNAIHGAFDNNLITNPKVTLESQRRQSAHLWF